MSPAPTSTGSLATRTAAARGAAAVRTAASRNASAGEVRMTDPPRDERSRGLLTCSDECSHPVSKQNGSALEVFTAPMIFPEWRFQEDRFFEPDRGSVDRCGAA